jgi:hypothetical protein
MVVGSLKPRAISAKISRSLCQQTRITLVTPESVSLIGPLLLQKVQKKERTFSNSQLNSGGEHIISEN